MSLRDTRHRARAERSRAELVATVAHELRSPLTSVKGFTATLLAKWDRFTDDQKRLMLETVNADADRVTRLITELLDISRIDSGRLDVRRQVVDLGAVVRQARRRRGGRAASDRRPVPPSRSRTALPEMWVDPDKIDQVLGNLLENAVRHGAGTGHDRGRARRRRQRPSPSTRRGRGHPATRRDRVFTAVLARSGRRGGTGLGLYIVEGLVEAHGGHIAVGRAPGGGAGSDSCCPPAPPTSPTDAVAGQDAGSGAAGQPLVRPPPPDLDSSALPRRSTIMSAPNKSYDPVEVDPA